MVSRGVVSLLAALAAAAVGCQQAPAMDPMGAGANALKAAPGAGGAGAVAAGCDCGGTNCGGGNCGHAGCNGKDCGGHAAAGTEQAQQAVRVPVDGSPQSGRAEALVTLVEFTDYQCPFCLPPPATVEQLAQEYGDRLRVVMKHRPLPMHPLATPAARAAAAAELQGKFWPMHRALFAAGGKLDDLDAVARTAGLDVGLWRASLSDGRIDDRLSRDAALAGKAGANGTPTFFINGRPVVGALPVERFRAVIDEELARAEALVKSGTPAAAVYEKLMAAASDEARAEAPRAAPSAPAPAPAGERVKVDLAGAPLKGAESAPVTVVVFSDFQCPFCSRAVGTLHALEQRYGDRVRFAFKQRPLSFHANARGAAAAALAAAEQGKFWEFHDALFAHQQELDRAGLDRRAQELGLDLPRFRAALDGGAAQGRIAADEAEAERLGVTGTPTFFINGRRVVGAQPTEAFAAVIDDELKLR